MRQSRRQRRKADAATSELTPKRGGDLIDDDISLRDAVPDPGSVQSNHATQGMGGDEERADPNDAKVKGRSRG